MSTPEDLFLISIDSTSEKRENQSIQRTSNTYSTKSINKQQIQISQSTDIQNVEIPSLSRLLFAWEDISWGVDHFNNPFQSFLSKYLPNKLILKLFV